MRTVTLLVLMSMSGGALAQQALDLPRALAAPTGIVALLGDLDCRLALSMAATTKHIYYVQLATAQEAEQARRKAAAAGLLGTRIFVDSGKLSHLHLADDLVDLLVVSKGIKFSDAEARRVINPLGKAILGDREITKEFPRGIDFWTHPQHGPDNNPRALDQIARAPYLTQFIAQPSWCPMPQVSVAAGGRMYKAYGHIAHRRLHQRWLNTLIGVNAYNGSILWERPLPEGFMIHRNTMVATDGGLYMGDAESCRVHHPDTGEIMREIVVPAGIADGSVWKWMGFDDDVLYALVGGKEIEPRTRKSNNRGYGHWPWGMWDGHDFKDPRSNFGFGRTLAAFAAKTGKLLWSHREEDFLDGRAVCMRKGRIYAFSPGRQLLCLEAKDGKEVWRNSTPELLNAVGKDGKAQLYTTGFSTSYYMSCNDDVILFAGPQRPNMVAVSTATGELLWTYKQGNFQAVFLDTDLFVAGGSRDERASYRLDIKTGKQLHKLRARAGCTHATANLDSVFFRGGGTVRIGIADNSVNHITPMRPPCQDGVITSNGLLYWGPWMCGCSLSLYGHISLGSRSTQGLVGTDPQLQTATVDAAATASGPEVKPGDWPCYRQTPAGSCLTRHRFPAAPAPVWSYQTGGPMPSAPVSVGEMIYLGDRSGAIRGIDAGSGKEKWQTFTGGMVVFPPFIAEGRAYAGAADGKVYALDAGTGQEQWSYRIAPAQRWIPVFGSLVSTWPAVGGVAVADGKVYAAGGIAHYDDTHVVALDAASGQLLWHNGKSGVLSGRTGSGISLQGALSLQDDTLRFVGGNLYPEAIYDRDTGNCETRPIHGSWSRTPSAFAAWYPDQSLPELLHKLPDGTQIESDWGRGNGPAPLMRAHPLPAGASKYGSNRVRQKFIWRDKGRHIFDAFLITPDMVIAAGARDDQQHKLIAFDLANGRQHWSIPLPDRVVKWGLAVDRQGRMLISMRNGAVWCLR